jgi:hypothetical protein
MPRCILIAIVGWLIFPVFAQDNVTNQVLIAVNQERQRISIAPLVMNPQLVEAAQNHSNDMAANATLTHIGSDGSQFWERIQRAGYNLSTGAENVLARRDTNPDSIFQQWFDSTPHRANMLNADYVEVGIAYARSTLDDYYVTMVLAARPGIVAPQPAIAIITASPTLTATSIPPTPIPSVTPIPTRTLMPTDVILATIIAPPPTFAPTQTPLRNTIVTSTPMPTASDTDLRLVYDADSFSLVNVAGRVLDLRGIVFRSDVGRMEIERWNTGFLSQSLSGFTDGDCLQVWGLGNEQLFLKPIECQTRHAWLAVGDAFIFWRDTDFFIVERNGVRIGLCEVASGSCDIALSANFGTSSIQATPALQNTPAAVYGVANVRLFITETSITLMNWSSSTTDVSGLVFESESGVFAASRWDNGFLSSPLNALPAGDCLQIWLVGGQYEQQPTECSTRHAWVAVHPDEQFWRDASVFHVRSNADVIVSCETRVRTCNFNLP